MLGILNQRAELLDGMDRAEDAELDRQRIDQLAPKGGSSTGSPLGLDQAIELVTLTASLLDTRGYLNFLMDDSSSAQRDLEQAVNAIEWAGRAFQWRIDTDKHFVIDIRPMFLEQKSLDQSIAVIRYHQMLVHEALEKMTWRLKIGSESRNLATNLAISFSNRRLPAENSLMEACKRLGMLSQLVIGRGNLVGKFVGRLQHFMEFGQGRLVVRSVIAITQRLDGRDTTMYFGMVSGQVLSQLIGKRFQFADHHSQVTALLR